MDTIMNAILALMAAVALTFYLGLMFFLWAYTYWWLAILFGLIAPGVLWWLDD